MTVVSGPWSPRSLHLPDGPLVLPVGSQGLTLVSQVTRGRKQVSAPHPRLEYLSGHCPHEAAAGEAHGERDPGTAPLTWLLKIIGHTQCREERVPLQLGWEM